MTNRLDLGSFSIPLDFASIEIGDYVRSADFPWLYGQVTRIVTVCNADGVMIDKPFGKSDVLLKGDIVPLGYAGAQAI